MESPETAQRRAALDLTIIGVLVDGGLRRSEAAALTWGDVELWTDGTGRLTVQKSKNQTELQTVAVTTATARALGEIRPENAGPAAPGAGRRVGPGEAEAPARVTAHHRPWQRSSPPGWMGRRGNWQLRGKLR